MIDKYKHDPPGVSNIITSLTSDKNEYENHIKEIENLINEINSSSSWKDELVKTEFINTCNSYLKKYQNIVLIMEKYINYLKNKNDEGSSTENTFARVGQHE